MEEKKMKEKSIIIVLIIILLLCIIGGIIWFISSKKQNVDVAGNDVVSTVVPAAELTEAPAPEPTEAPTPEPTETPIKASESVPIETPIPEKIPVVTQGAETEEQVYQIELIDAGEQKVSAIKIFRDYSGVGLAIANETIKNLPSVVFETTNKEDALGCMKAFEESGAQVKLYIYDKETVTGSEEDTTQEADKVTYVVYMENVGYQKVKAIKEYREFTGLGLAAAKYAIDSAPVVLYIASNEEEAKSLCENLLSIGCTVSVEAMNDEQLEMAKKLQYGDLYYVFLKDMGKNKREVMNAYSGFFGMAGADVEARELSDEVPLTVFVTDNKELSDTLLKALQDAGAVVEIILHENTILPPKEILPEDKKEIATFQIKNSRFDPKMNIMFGGKMLYGNISVGDKVYVVLEDGSAVPFTVRRTYCLDERVDSVQAGDLSALMFEESISSEEAEKAVKIVKRKEA